MNIHDDIENKSTTQADAGTQEQEAKQQNNNVNSINYQEQFLRVSADFANYKKRIERDRLDWMQSAERMVIQKMLPIIDDLDRAIMLAQEKTSTESNAWLEGFVLIQKNMQKTFTDLGVKEINTLGIFNPELHEALMNVQNSEKQSGEIVDVLRKGYMLNEKVIRHAQVSVAL